MSASLVGSEMCIRDSCHLVAEAFPALPPHGSEGARQFAGEVCAAYVVPVSYTHLTLPTICSV
eukprot:11883081-Alexandrium_andersonii.AAC.1